MGRARLIESIVKTTADYREGELDRPDAAHVDRWLAQFPKDAQDQILFEIDHVLSKSYISRKTFGDFIAGLVTNERLAAGDSKRFWKTAGILAIQQNGNSQREMLVVLDEALKAKHRISIKECDASSGVYVYLDDAVFSGGHVRNDITRWIGDEAPKKAVVHIVLMALYSGGEYFADQQIQAAAKKAGKAVQLHWWRVLSAENRRRYLDHSDVLAPAAIPKHKLTLEYVEMLKKAGYPPVLRRPGSVGPAQFFSSEERRNILEQEFLKSGTEIRSQCPYLNDYQRPLGNMVLNTLGFGATIVTFRNCPNNCPLALWAGDPWYPLFERKIN